MNIMRKLVGSTRSSTEPPLNSVMTGGHHSALGLMHLKKLFSEYLHPNHTFSERERDEKLYQMQPLFNKVFGNSPTSDLIEKFPDSLSFCQHVSKLMVSEIRRRANDKSTVAASWSIVQFLEIENNEESSNGWMLLTTINLLASGDVSFIEVMTACALPSTLVKCLCLFFDLTESDSKGASEFTPEERRILLQKVFVQILVRLCSHVAPTEEIVRKDDLRYLFSTITCVCPPHNLMWRKSSADVLMTLSRHGLTPSVIEYIHVHRCIAACINNMKNNEVLSPLEMVEMFVAIFCFLKDSSEQSQVLLEDFRKCNGYAFLTDFLVKLECLESQEAKDALRNLVLIISSLVMCGFTELKPSCVAAGSLFQLPDFILPQPTNKGSTVRNIHAFQVLRTIFLKSSSQHLSCVVLDSISSIYHADECNYFILESQSTLSQFAEKIHMKDKESQMKFFQLLEFLVFHLNFVPCKELIALSLLIRTQSSVSCNIICMDTLLNILRYNVAFKDVFREVGILEVFVSCLHKFAALMKRKDGVDGDDGLIVENIEEQERFSYLVIEALTLLLNGNTANSAVFREASGSQCVSVLVNYEQTRQSVLSLVQQLILSGAAEDDMAALLEIIHSSPSQQVDLKIDVLRTLHCCLKESHRCRTTFRKVGGFVYLMSIMVSMEKCASLVPPDQWLNIAEERIVTLLHSVFNTISMAMRFEPGSAKYFHQEICRSSLCSTLRLLGCFSDVTVLETTRNTYDSKYEHFLQNLFSCDYRKIKFTKDIPRHVGFACIILRLLYETAIDVFDRSSHAPLFIPRSPLKRANSSNSNTSSSPKYDELSSPRRLPPASLNLSGSPAPDPVIVHSGIVVGMLHLLPSLTYQSNQEMNKVMFELQFFVSEVLKSLVRSERNQQIMCDAGLPTEILKTCYLALEDESHSLHPQLQYMLERLAAQSLEPADLRAFFRLGSPFNCISSETPDNAKSCGLIPLTRVKTLVSMTTPRDSRLHGASLLPQFVEFDMGFEGFGCLYLPSIAPQNLPVSGVANFVGNESQILGGIGSGDRVFPPQAGLSYSTWFCVDKFSDSKSDPHCVRLLTVVRHLHGRDDHLICFQVALSSRDKALLVSTQERPLPVSGGHHNEWEPDIVGDWGVRIWCPDLLQEGQWHHMVLVLSRAVLKNSSFQLYVDGQLVTNQKVVKLHYILQNPGGGAANLTVASSVYSYIGTPPCYRRYSRLSWKQGPCHLIEDILSQPVIQILYQLGPGYQGSLQAPEVNGDNALGPLVPEEKIIFGLNAMAMSQLTLSKIRKVYSKPDSKSISKQLGMSTHENATPIRILHNSAGHLNGPARSLGGVVIGYLGVRVFCPRPVAKMIDNVGGCSILLGLIAMAHDVESVYAGVKALVCVVKSNKQALLEIDRIHGYQILGMLFRKKSCLLNSHILHLIFSLVGTVDSGRETTVIPNKWAFRDLLTDLEVWKDAPGDLQRTLYEHFYELLTESAEQKTNLRLMQDMNIVPKLLKVLQDKDLSDATLQLVYNVLGVLVGNTPRSADILCLGQFLISTLPESTSNEKLLNLKNDETDNNEPMDLLTLRLIQRVKLRNKCLALIYNLMHTGKGINGLFCEELIKFLGFDWLMLFMLDNMHPTTTILAFRMLVVLLSNQHLLQKFRDTSLNGGWLRETQAVVENRAGVVLGFTVPSVNSDNRSPSNKEVHEEACHIPGFQLLNWCLPSHVDLPEIYFLLLALMLGQPVRHLPTSPKLDLDSILQFVFGPNSGGHSMALLSSRVNICQEAIISLLGMVRGMLNQNSDDNLPQWLQEYPVAIIQFLMYLYHNNNGDFLPVFMSGEVLCALAATVYPYQANSESTSSVTSPIDETKATSELLEKDKLVYIADENATCLSQHPAKKFVMDFCRILIVDSLSLSWSTKGPPIIDLLLEASPENCSHTQLCQFQTELLGSLMEHLLAADILLNDSAAIPIVSVGNQNNVMPNVFYVAGRLVDKLWQGVFNKDPHEVFDFIIQVISQAKRHTPGVNLETSYHCLNRVILFILSRPVDDIAGQMALLEILQKLINQRTLVFGAGNHELEFIGCLIYCLIQFNEDMPVRVNTNAKTMWHVNPNIIEPELKSDPGHGMLISSASRVWEELYVCKKPAIEEVFRIPLPPCGNKNPDLGKLREHILDSAQKLWITYIENERKNCFRIPWELQNQLQTKLQKVTGGLSRLASRTKSRREDTHKVRLSNINFIDYLAWSANHISIVKELVELKERQHIQSLQYMQQYIMEDWKKLEAELTRERGLWGPMVGCDLDKWMLDPTEGPSRMRKKMTQNYLFYENYPYRPETDSSDSKPYKYKIPSSLDSKEYYLKMCPKRMITHDSMDTEGVVMSEVESNLGGCSFDEGPNTPVNANSCSESGIPDLPSALTHRRHISETEEDTEDPSDQAADVSTRGENVDNQTLLRLLEEGEKISHMFRCARIQGLDTSEGLLLFGKEHFYVVDGFTLLKTREIRDIEQLPPNIHDPIIPSTNPSKKPRDCSKFPYDEVREVHKRRYLLQPIALEVFSSDGRNHLLAFPRKTRNKVYQRFLSLATEINDNAQESVAGQKRNASVEQGAGILSSLIGEMSVTQRWVRGEITNFQYLMHLNTLAGRSYNDLMQYPIFPWILADYENEELDLTDPCTFRDLSRPMGAQSPQRLEQFKKRYKEWDDPHGETPPYHYGTHYSSAMIVCSYLVRMEPFTQHFLRLQGGHFDLADRMFHSIKEAWLSASKHNMADVKELIPEFFYLPEFLMNSNRFDLGTKQSGVILGDVVLPPWAKSDPREFIRVHRQALECDYVSHHLHEWIDLIFGFKQQGQSSIDAVNVFHHLFYEGNVDIYSIDDPLKKNATIGFINNFGQIPKQLFKKPHPQKKVIVRLVDHGPITPGLSISNIDKLFFHNLDNLKPSLQPIKELKSAIGQIIHGEKMLLAVEQNKTLIPPNFIRYFAWGFADHSLRVGNYESDKATFVSETPLNGEILTAACPNSKTIITGGTNTVVNVWELKNKKMHLKKNLNGHTEAVTCLAASQGFGIIVSGSRDCTCIVWDLARLTFVRQLRNHAAPVAALSINELTGEIATCAGTWLYVWTINGDEIACVNTATGRSDRLQQILCVTFSQLNEWDSQNVVMTGSSDGIVRMWSLDYVAVPSETEGMTQSQMYPQSFIVETNPLAGMVASTTELGSQCESDLSKSRSSAENVDGGELVKSCSESSLSDLQESCITDKTEEPKETLIEGYSIVTEAEVMQVREPQDHLAVQDTLVLSEVVVRRRESRDERTAHFRKSEGFNIAVDLEDESDGKPHLRQSKSETSLCETFVLICDSEAKETIAQSPKIRAPKNPLREGFKWQCQLVFRSKLTMHTAYDRRDNMEPASITAIAVSRDHRTVYVGDARGRIFSWSVTDQPGRVIADHWMKDEGFDSCQQCGVKFSIYERRHHCRNCGQLFCSKCSRFESEISRLRILNPVRVCQHCYKELRSH